VDEKSWAVRDLIDLGDLILVSGPLGQTNKGETTIWATQVEMASKALLSPPAKWEGLSDVELRYRQRYVDLWANPEVMTQLKLRMQIVGEIRKYMADRGYLEVETPMMQPLAGGAAARPFVTHHRALDIPLYLRIAPELYLKRLLVGGFTKVFELNRNFRNEGISPRHNPEFTMLEAYEAFGSWETMADLVEGMICHLAETLFGGLRIVHKRATAGEGSRVGSPVGSASADATSDRQGGAQLRTIPSAEADPTGSGAKAVTEGTENTESTEKSERVINLQRPWRRVRMVDLVEERTGWKFTKKSLFEDEVAAQRVYRVYEPDFDKLLDVSRTTTIDDAQERRLVRVTTLIHHLRNLSPAEQLQEVYEKLIEPTLIDPTFVTHVPSVIIPLARKNKEDPFFADVYELAINGQEISPGYTELNDPDVQEKNFAHQVGDKEEQQKVDEDFLNALRYGMPPAGGMGLGIDRLVMMLTGAQSIRDVILFPLMKPVT
jgi:lysyl-tRNA synthetase class 2